jgi:hypothetical protein
MQTRTLRRVLLALAIMAATTGTAAAQTCLSIDEPRDMLTPDERTAALILVRRQFEQAGQPVAESNCASTHLLSHVRLGSTIIVSLSGPLGSREGTARGVDDLPALYSQLVRSLTTGEPMGSLAVVDRTNVTAAQSETPRRFQSDGVWYARLGHSSLFARSTYNGPMFGFGYRAEFDRLGLDVSFLNFQPPGGGLYSDGASAMTLIKLSGLYFVSPPSSRSAYFGAGLSYGSVDLDTTPFDQGLTSGHGRGLQGELTAGYEFARVTSVRLFAQADVTLPFYNIEFETVSYQQTPPGAVFVPPTITTESVYAPTLTVSVGVGWGAGRR